MDEKKLYIAANTLVPWFDEVAPLLEEINLDPCLVLEVAIASYHPDPFRHESCVCEDIMMRFIERSEEDRPVDNQTTTRIMAFIIDFVTPEVYKMLNRLPDGTPIMGVTSIIWVNDANVLVGVEVS